MSTPVAKRPIYLGKDRQKARALVSVPLTPAEWRRLKIAARRRKVALSRFLRESALRVAAEPSRPLGVPNDTVEAA